MSSAPKIAMTGIGATLRAARDHVDVSIEEAAWRTRIRPEYLRALEDERFAELGHHAFARGYLHTYARFLGLDATPLVEGYRDAFERAEISPIEHLNTQAREAKRPPKPNWPIAGALAALVLIAAAVAGVVRGPGPRTTSSANRLPTLPATGAQLEPSASAPAPAPAPQATGVTVVVVASGGKTWVRAVVDGEVAFEGLLEDGQTRTFTGIGRVDVTIGSIATTRLIVNGRDLGSPPSKGSVYRASFGPQGDIAAQ